MASSTNTSNEQGETTGRALVNDLEWLASLSEPELDFLISLKQMAIRRAKNVGYKHLGEKFDLRILRSLGAIMLEYLKDRVQSTSIFSNSAEILTLLSSCRLSIPSKENLGSISCTKDINTPSFVTSRRKRMFEGLREEPDTHNKKQKKEETYM